MVLLLVVTEPAAVEPVAAGSLEITAMFNRMHSKMLRRYETFWFIDVRL